MSRDSIKQQILDACGRVKSAAEIMGFLMSVARMRKRDYPDDPADSPRLMVTISMSGLATKTGYSLAQVKRGVSLLRRRGFISSGSELGETNAYLVNAGAVDRWLQRMPLFEQDDTSDLAHDEPPPWLTMSHPPGSSRATPLAHDEPSPPYSASNSIISIKENDDDAKTFQTEKKEAVVRPVPAHAGSGPSAEAPDQDRDAIIDQYRAIDITKEHAEALLTDHSRQKLRAALLKLATHKRQGRPIKSTDAGFVIGYLRNPAGYGDELDQHGCWRPSRDIARERRQTIKARDRPACDPAQAAAVAWDSLTTKAQQAIRIQLTQSHPDDSPARRLQRCREHALLTTQPQDHSHDEDAREAAETRQSQG